MRGSPAQLLPILQGSWSPETSGQWSLENPARGQCNVTCLVVNDLYGGEILKTETPGGWHFYNRVGGEGHDLTADQFAAPVDYWISQAPDQKLSPGPEQYEDLRRALALRRG